MILTAFEMSFGEAKSQETIWEFGEICFNKSHNESKSGLLLASAITDFPEFASDSAIERPKPLDAPVTRNESLMPPLMGLSI